MSYMEFYDFFLVCSCSIVELTVTRYLYVQNWISSLTQVNNGIANFVLIKDEYKLAIIIEVVEFEECNVYVLAYKDFVNKFVNQI